MKGPTLEDVLGYAASGWKVFPLTGKVPAIPAWEGGRGVLDATSDEPWLRAHWKPGHNIGARVHAGLFVIDTDPRHGGEDNLIALANDRGELPETLTAFSGRGDGGRHRYYLRPAGKLSARQLPEGVDLKTSSGYTVVPPSLHPDTGRPYAWANPDVPPAPCPAWLAELLTSEPEPHRERAFPARVVNDGDSIADWFTSTTTWAEILEPHGWTEVRSGWRHPNATSPVSATIRHDLLFVYSPNTPFEPTEAESPRGITRFRAWAILNHGGDLSAAARAARSQRQGALAS